MNSNLNSGTKGAKIKNEKATNNQNLYEDAGYKLFSQSHRGHKIP